MHSNVFVFAFIAALTIEFIDTTSATSNETSKTAKKKYQEADGNIVDKISSSTQEDRSGSAYLQNRKIPVFRDENTGTIFVKQGKQLFIQNQNGYFYPHNIVLGEQVEQAEHYFVIKYNATGLNGLRQKYLDVHGMPAFIKSLISMEPRQREFHDLLKCPECFPYFEDLHFLIIPNKKFDPSAEYATAPKSQKLKVNTFIANAWFIHPQSSCLTKTAKQLLHELSDQAPPEKPLLQKLRAQAQEKPHTTYNFDPTNRDSRTIGELTKLSKYYASMLDLSKEDLPMLQQLKQKTLQHLAKQYGVTEHDHVALYFHFPYTTVSTTLHMHIRVNYANHPYEERRSFTVDTVMEELANGKTIDSILLERAAKNGKVYRAVDTNLVFFTDIPGLSVIGIKNNDLRLSPKKSERLQVYSKDDLNMLANTKSSSIVAKPQPVVVEEKKEKSFQQGESPADVVLGTNDQLMANQQENHVENSIKLEQNGLHKPFGQDKKNDCRKKNNENGRKKGIFRALKKCLNEYFGSPLNKKIIQ